MGFNTTVFILNDHLHNIEEDPELGKKIARASCNMIGKTEPQEVHSGIEVVNCSHADEMVVMVAGANSCMNFGYITNWRHLFRDQNDNNLPVEETNKRILRCLARKMGYNISIKDDKKKRK